MAELREQYNEHLSELFFLQHGGNMIDYMSWKRKPPPQLVACLQAGALDSLQEVTVLSTSGGATPLATPVAVSTTLPPAVSAIQQQGR